MADVYDHLALLGVVVRDKVTGLSGVVTSVAFDLYGCIQVILNPGIDKDGRLQDCNWFDIARVEVINTDPVMSAPDFTMPVLTVNGQKGPSEKPKLNKP